MKSPLRKVVGYTDASGVMKLECGHIGQKRPGRGHPTRSRCETCLPLEMRQALLMQRRKRK